MNVSLSFEKTCSCDVSIMVDALRASTTITLALNNFHTVIPCFSPDEAIQLSKKYNGVVAGERDGCKLEGFDVGNSPVDVENFNIDSNKCRTLVLTTTNGTRILKDMHSTVLIGCLLNAKSVAKKALEISEGEIDVVMAGIKGDFALEDFLVSGEILYWIDKFSDCNLTDFAKSAIIASRNYNHLQKGILKSKSACKLKNMGKINDVECCLLKNVSDNVAIYKNGKLKLS